MVTTLAASGHALWAAVGSGCRVDPGGQEWLHTFCWESSSVRRALKI